MSEDKLVYSFELNQFEQDNVYANLPNSVYRASAENGHNNHNHHQPTGQNHQNHNHHNYGNHRNHLNENNDNFEVHHYEPKGPTVGSQVVELPLTMQLPVKPTEAQLIAYFKELAESVNVTLTDDLTRHILTLIRLGVPPDDIYIFIRECIESKRTSSNA